jgi:hypothetical protein
MLMENSGIIPEVISSPPQTPKRRRIIRDSILLTLVAWLTALVSTLFWDIGVPLEIVAKLGSFVFFLLGFVGLLRFSYGFLFVDDTAQATPSTASAIRAMPENPTQASLPPPKSVPVTDYWPRSNTKEIVSPPSVTENTTRLLEDPDN